MISTRLSCKVNNRAVENMATGGARASATMVFTWLSRNIPREAIFIIELPWHNPNWIIIYVADIKVSSRERNCCFDCDYTDVTNQPSLSDWVVWVPLCPSGLGVGLSGSERPGVRSPHSPLHW